MRRTSKICKLTLKKKKKNLINFSSRSKRNILNHLFKKIYIVGRYLYGLEHINHKNDVINENYEVILFLRVQILKQLIIKYTFYITSQYIFLCN